MISSRPFWIVWSPQGTLPPRRTHFNFAEAVTAADSMALRHPGSEFFVMAGAYGCKVEGLCRAMIDQGDMSEQDIPF